MFVLAITVSLASGASSALAIQLVHEFINEGSAAVTYFYPKFTLVVFCFGVFGVLSSYLISVVTQAMIFKLRTELSRKVLQASYQASEQRLDKILPVLTADINFISASMNRLPPVVTGFSIAIGCFILLFTLSWQLTSASFLLFFFAFLTNYLVLPYLKKYSELARDEWDKIHKNFEGIVYGMKELKLNQEHRENFIENNIEPNCTNERGYRIKEETFYASSSRFAEVILFLGIGVFMYFVDMSSWIPRDEFGSYLLVLILTVAPLATVTGFLKHIKRTEVSLSKIADIGVSLTSDTAIIEKQTKPCPWDEHKEPLFSFKDILFTHQGESEFSIGPIDLEVNKGEIIYIIGGNGSGKTTFIKMLCGLYHPIKGSIHFKNKEIGTEDLDYFRRHFAGVFTDYHLFDDLHHIDEEILARDSPQLLEQLELDQKVSIVNKKISSTRLSYGQRKRLAMMVSILEDKDVYIFDEWAANQDPHFKEKFYVELLPQLKAKGKTVIAISHDEQYFKHADKVYKMIEGKLVTS